MLGAKKPHHRRREQPSSGCNDATFPRRLEPQCKWCACKVEATGIATWSRGISHRAAVTALLRLAPSSDSIAEQLFHALVTLSLSLIRLMIERDWRIRDHGLQAHDDMFNVSDGDNHRSGVLIGAQAVPLESRYST